MRATFVRTTNVAAMLRSHEVIASRQPGEPGLAIIHGAPGRGKTTAIIWLANQIAAVLVQALPLWTPRWMLSAIIRELGGQPHNHCQPMFDFIIASLTKNPRPLILDEADRIAKREDLVETLRAIHDLTNVSILLVGMADFRRSVSHRPQLARRVAREVEFKPATLDDARLLARELCEIELADAAIVEMHKRSNGSIGLLVNALAEEERLARKAGIARVRAA